jgi:hypothetical protein
MGISRYEKLMTRLKTIATKMCMMRCCLALRITKVYD